MYVIPRAKFYISDLLPPVVYTTPFQIFRIRIQYTLFWKETQKQARIYLGYPRKKTQSRLNARRDGKAKLHHKQSRYSR